MEICLRLVNFFDRNQPPVVHGAGGNLGSIAAGQDLARHPEISGWLERIRPVFVQVYSLDRDTPAKDLRKLAEDELDFIIAQAYNIGLQAESFARYAT